MSETTTNAVDKIDRKLSIGERESLKREIEMGEASMAASGNLKTIGVDPRVKNELIRKRMLLAKDDDLAAVGDRRDSLEAEEKKLREIIRNDIPTKNEMWPGKDQSDKNRALQHNLRFQAKYQDAMNYKTPEGKITSVVHRWKELNRRLNPENPFAGNLDELRRDS